MVGQFIDDDGLFAAVVVGLDVGFGADVDAAAPAFVGFADAFSAVNQRAGGEVGAGQVAHQGAGVGIGVVKQVQTGVERFAEVVRRHVGRHADGDAGAAIDEQVGDARRQHGRLLLAAVVVRRKIHGFFFDVGEQAVRDFRHARFGVAVGGGRVAIQRAEVALAIHQRVAQREGLRHAHQGVVNGAVAVRVVFPHDVANDGRGFHIFLVPGIALFVHGKQHAAMYRLQAVARVRQGTADNHAHRVIKIRTAHLVFQANRQHFFGKITHCFQPYNVKKPPDAANIRYGITNGQPSLRHPATDAFRIISTTESRLQAPLQRIFLCIFATKHL